jgi:beta-glucosidase
MLRKLTGILTTLFAVVLINGCGPKWIEVDNGDFKLVHNKGGQTLAYSPKSGIKLITDEGFAFKDLNKNGELDVYEDWRKPVDERAKDLASKMSVEQIAGLMLYSGHQSIPARSRGFGGGTYNGKTLEESGAKAYDLSDQQIKFLTDDNLRHVLITTVESPVVAAQWNNNMQALVEGLGLGIPGNTSSDPRHLSDSNAEYNAGAGGQISMWPSTLGLAATFDPAVMKQFGEIASIEYRALGITTALSPQIDLATEPRWSRFSGTMGEDPDLAADLARAYVDGFQSSSANKVIANDWGYESVNAMVKHWPGGGPEEGGRDGHFGYGAYAVYPGGHFEDHLKPFTEGAFKLEGETKMASAVMPYYTISYNIDKKNGENVGNGFSKYLIKDLLRGEYGYDGVLSTDWMITADVPNVYEFSGKCWGVENLSVAERHYKAIMAGMDQFGGNNVMAPVLEAYQMGVKEYGEEFMRQRFEQSAVRLLKNIFQPGLFENPYLEVEESAKTVGNVEFMEAGYQAQLKSIVMLKNKNNTLPLKKTAKVYIPQKYVPGGGDWFGNKSEPKLIDAANIQVAGKYFEIVDSPEKADAAVVIITSPEGGVGYSVEDLQKGGNGYVPINLQYGPYKANFARETSMGGGSPFEDFTNRSYKGKTGSSANVNHMQQVNQTKTQMGKKPVIVVVEVSNPFVPAEFEKSADALLVHSGVQEQALMDILTGEAEPSGLLPYQLPANMKTVDTQFEDVSRDMECYRDEAEHVYDFAFGLNWNGVINDERVKAYK